MLFGKHLFVIKEAVYKAFYPAVGEFLDFHDVDVKINTNFKSFYAEVHRVDLQDRGFPVRFAGALTTVSGHIVAFALPLAV